MNGCAPNKSNLEELHIKCSRCKREMPEECIYYKHPEYGVVCEYCPEFTDGLDFKSNVDEQINEIRKDKKKNGPMGPLNTKPWPMDRHCE